NISMATGPVLCPWCTARRMITASRARRRTSCRRPCRSIRKRKSIDRKDRSLDHMKMSGTWFRAFSFPGSMRSILFLLLIGTFHGSNAQLLDSISLFLQQPPVFVARLDMRGSFVRNTNVKIFGAKFGLEHAGRFQY